MALAISGTEAYLEALLLRFTAFLNRQERKAPHCCTHARRGPLSHATLGKRLAGLTPDGQDVT